MEVLQIMTRFATSLFSNRTRNVHALSEWRKSAKPATRTV